MAHIIVGPRVEPQIEPNKGSSPLRTAVLVDSLNVQRWQHNILDALDRAPHIKLVLIAEMVHPTGTSGAPEMPRRAGLLKLYQLVDSCYFRNRSMRPDVFLKSTFSPSHSAPLILQFHTPENLNNFEVDPNRIDAKSLERANLDLILDLSSAIPNQLLYPFARYGVWSFEDANTLVRDIFWHLFDRSPILENKIEILSGASDTGTLTCSYSAVDSFSLFRNHSNSCWNRKTDLLRCLDDLNQYGWQHVRNAMIPKSESDGATPANLDVARLLGRVLGRAVRSKIRRSLFHEHWFIAYRKTPMASDRKQNSEKLTILRAPSNRFYADPFVIDRAEKTYIFFEDYSYDHGKGVISFVEIDPVSGDCSVPETVLEEPFHLSYPCLSQWNDEIYLLPESKNDRTIRLYKAMRFPREWKLEKVLFKDVAAVDSTLFEYNGKFWLFTSGIGTSDPWFDGKGELFLFFSESPFGPWKAHPRNPVVSDIRRSRPAGGVISSDGQLIRPGQNYSGVESHGVIFNLVDILSETEYHERPVAKIGPEWMPGNIGTHTFNASRGYQVIDGRTLVHPLSRRTDQPTCEVLTHSKPLIQNVVG